MAEFNISTEKVIETSQEIMEISARLKRFRRELENVRLKGGLKSTNGERIDTLIKRVLENVSDEAVKLDSFGDALQLIADKYRTTENTIVNMQIDSLSDRILSTESATSGTDKRNWWEKFVDWIFQKEPDDYEATSEEQEKAADDAMKKELWNVLQDEKYSEESWNNASIDERKQILQDYMDEVIEIYDLQDVKSNIVWDSNATYTTQSITWGYYTHGKHTVTLNEQALADNIGNWKSYELQQTVAHELRHAYQHEAINHPTDYMVSQETIDIWEKNFDNYISSSTDYQKYRKQPVEVDARDFEITRTDVL